MGNGVYQLYEPAIFMRKTIAETQYKVKTTLFCFSSCMGVLLGDIADWWVKDFRYNVMQSQIQVASIVMVPM
jgi:hypothetical protein